MLSLCKSERDEIMLIGISLARIFLWKWLMKKTKIVYSNKFFLIRQEQRYNLGGCHELFTGVKIQTT